MVRFVDLINLRVQLEVVVDPNADSNRSMRVDGLLNHGLVGEQVAVEQWVKLNTLFLIQPGGSTSIEFCKLNRLAASKNMWVRWFG